MEELLLALIKPLVTKPENVRIETVTSAEDGLIVYRIYVAEEDMGLIIGKRGRTAKSIRQTARAAAMRKNMQIAVEIG